MRQSLSLRARLSLLLGGVLAVGLALGVGLLVLRAGARVRVEAEGAMRLARDLVQARAPQLDAAADPQEEIARLLAEARRLRHVRVALAGSETTAPPDRRAPRWFAALVFPATPETRVETARATFVIAANPSDEIAEIWQEIVALAVGGVGVFVAAFALAAVAVSRALRPVTTLAEGLQRLERGDHAARVSANGPPEFVAIAERLNALAAALQRLDEENHRLVRRMIHVQDEERRAIARDLHDEIGPFLFTVRAGVGALARKAMAPEATPAAMARDCARIDAQIAALQQVNRNILGRLRPAALEEMGLADALSALAQGWRERHPGVAIALTLEGARGALDETIALTAYRIVQEGLTNAFRHARAAHIAVEVARDGAALRITVRDDGVGLTANRGANGLGLRGMSERVGALGGALRVENAPGGGVALRADMPLGRDRSGNYPD